MQYLNPLNRREFLSRSAAGGALAALGLRGQLALAAIQPFSFIGIDLRLCQRRFLLTLRQRHQRRASAHRIAAVEMHLLHDLADLRGDRHRFVRFDRTDRGVAVGEALRLQADGGDFGRTIAARAAARPCAGPAGSGLIVAAASR